ncbi:MAG: uncharacterized protein K0R12_1267 [Gammaproteobacteria bacterium]|jgi:hypothetical protein|nr:uncharacterized protein [Gammaproteobacteria bacterium]
MKLLGFQIKRNLRAPPRIYVVSLTTKTNYGSFIATQPDTFEGWEKMNKPEIIELQQFMLNLQAITKYLGEDAIEKQADFRFRLPMNFSAAMDEIRILCYQNDIELNIYDPIFLAIIQELKIATAKLKGAAKEQALVILDKIGLAEYKKLNHEQTIKVIFSELLSIPNKAERLDQQVKALFEKDNYYSPKAIEGMSQGTFKPPKWVVTCAIVVLLEEKPAFLKKLLSEDDFFNLLAKPLLNADHKRRLMKLIEQYDLGFLDEKVKVYCTKKSK